MGALTLRTVGLMTSFMCITDSIRRNTNLMTHLPGQFITAACAGSFAWFIVWPFENLKNVIQSGNQDMGQTWS